LTEKPVSVNILIRYANRFCGICEPNRMGLHRHEKWKFPKR